MYYSFTLGSERTKEVRVRTSVKRMNKPTITRKNDNWLKKNPIYFFKIFILRAILCIIVMETFNTFHKVSVKKIFR